MRINHKIPPEEGEHRKRSGFLYFPKTIDYQTRWLERASWDEIYTITCSDEYTVHAGWEGFFWLEDYIDTESK